MCDSYHRKYTKRSKKLIGREQTGFVLNSPALTASTQQCANFRPPLHLIFFDFEKGFDNANRERFLRGWRKTLEKLIAIFRAMVQNVKCCIQVKSLRNSKFKAESGKIAFCG